MGGASEAPADGGAAAVAARAALGTLETAQATEADLVEARTRSPAELLAFVQQLKKTANTQFAAGEVGAACGAYERGTRLLRLVAEGDLQPAEVGSWRDAKLSLRLNSAACALKEGRHEQALIHSDAALAISPTSTKALFRRAQALQALGRREEAVGAYTVVVEREPSSREAHARLAELRGSSA